MHVIRLRAAWTVESGRATRRFNRPTGLDPGERVYVAWDGASPDASLNGERIDELSYCGPPRFDITDRLSAANELVLGTDNGAVLESVRLEIEGPSA